MYSSCETGRRKEREGDHFGKTPNKTSIMKHIPSLLQVTGVCIISKDQVLSLYHTKASKP